MTDLVDVTQLGGRPVTIHFGTTEGLPTEGVLGLDVESTWMGDQGQFAPDFQVRTVQFASTEAAWVLDLTDPMQRRYAVSVLAGQRWSFCSHTDMDVMAVYGEFGIDISERNLDTRMLAIEADPDRNADRDLKSLAAAYGMSELEQAEVDLHTWMQERWVVGGGKKNAARAAVHEAGWNALARMPATQWPPVFTRYAGMDAIACRRLVESLIPATGNPPEVLEMDQWLHVQATRLRIAGKRVDSHMLEEMLAEARLVAGTAKSKATELTGGVNPAGPKILDWFAEHGVDWDAWEGPRTKDTQAPSLAKDAISLLEDFPIDDVARRVVAEMRTFKGWTDVLNKTEEINRRMVWHRDGVPRIHPLLNPVGAGTTARMSSSGPNMQNFSKHDPRLRGLFLPEEGHVLMTIDFAQIELRIVAALAREEKMIEVIKGGGDLHQLTVDLLAELGVGIVRDTGKMSNFLIVYGGGGRALHHQAGIPLETAYEVVQTQKAAYPAITAFSRWLAMEKKEIRTVSGRRLPVTMNKKTGDIRAYANINYAVQSAGREALAYGWRRFDRRRPGMVWWPVHDELILQVPIGLEEEVAADAKWAMTFDFRGVPIEADAVVLRDENGVSRWMDGKRAEKIAQQRQLVAV
jgi:DNA polymerase-1